MGLRLIILLALSAALMGWNHRHPTLSQQWRGNLSLVTTPIMSVANAPFALFDEIANRFRAQSSLLNENTTLRAQVMILAGQLQKLQSIQTENRALRVLLQSSAVTHHLRLMLAQVMAIQASPYVQEIILNKGSCEGVFVGQAVLDAHGIMGQVIEAAPYTSRVLLLTDTRSGIPIQDERTGLRGILVGQGGSGLLRLVNMPVTSDIRAGDTLISSGLGGNYPIGYPVGAVASVNPYTTDQFLSIQVMPRAQLNSSEQVLLVWPDKKKLP